MNNFKKGDKIRCIDDSVHGLIKGEKHYILRTSHNGEENIITILNVLNKEQNYKARRFEVVTQAMPTPHDLAMGVYNLIMLRNGDVWDCATDMWAFKRLNEDLKPKTKDEGIDSDVMAVYKKNGYELELCWSRPEEKAKEEQIIIEKLLFVLGTISDFRMIDEQIAIREVIKILRG